MMDDSHAAPAADDHGHDHGHEYGSRPLDPADLGAATGSHHPDQNDEHGDIPHPQGQYLKVFIALCGLTLLSFIADQLGHNAKLIVGTIVLVIASFKAACVMLYFMHLKFEAAWKYALLGPTMVLAMAVPAGLFPDIGGHYYEIQTPQTAEYERIHSHDAPHDPEHDKDKPTEPAHH